MSTIQSKVTVQGQISVPAEVRRAGKCSSADVHVALFGTTRPGRTKPTDVKAGVRDYIRRKHARG